ncbi:hypothetical protein CDL15_Pgr006807 [Punica granatum]|uniref:Uncharacterized protein n=1 Tax=Punica granatum TaxID=22663 RepID=A0A218X753_PUNGR|nr:hypothetical protein CDL15_Pgr006807 [Punica granatum]
MNLRQWHYELSISSLNNITIKSTEDMAVGRRYQYRLGHFQLTSFFGRKLNAEIDNITDPHNSKCKTEINKTQIKMKQRDEFI